MVTRLLGRKLGMTQIYNEKGQCFPVTVIEAGPCTVTQVKTKDNDGYAAVQISFGTRRSKNISRAEMGHLITKGDLKADERKKAFDRQLKETKSAPEILREVPWDGKEEVKVGAKFDVGMFDGYKKVDVIGTSKGRGFMGVVRRWGFHGLPATHGQSDRERAPAPWAASTRSRRASTPARRWPATGASSRSPAATSTSSRSRRTRT